VSKEGGKEREKGWKGKGKGVEKMATKFVSSVETPHVFRAKSGRLVSYAWEKDHLIVEGSVFMWSCSRT
jgi:hypothetical protein